MSDGEQKLNISLIVPSRHVLVMSSSLRGLAANAGHFFPLV